MIQAALLSVPTDRPGSSPARSRRQALMRLGLMLAVTLTSGACGEDAGGDANAPATEPHVLTDDEVALVQLGDLSEGVLVTGSLRPFRVVDLRAQVPGTIRRIMVDRGERVREGQLMAVIDAEGIRSQASGAQAQVAAAQARVAVARRQVESARKLHEAGALSDIALQTAEAEYEAAQAQLAAARAQAAGAGESAERTNIRAPITGEVSQRHVEEGEAVSPGQALFQVVDATQLELFGQVPVNQAGQVQAGMPVEFTLDAYPGQTFEGQVARVEPTADPDTRQVGVYLRVPNESRLLFGGVFASGRIQTGSSEATLVVPEAAVRRQGNASYVWVVEDGRARRRDVVVGASDPESGRIAIASGVEPGDTVIAVPGEVEEGDPVRIQTNPTGEGEG